MKSKHSSAAKFDGAVRSRQSVAVGAHTRNFWTVQGFAPLMVSDPRKLLDLSGAGESILTPDGKLWLSKWKRLKATLLSHKQAFTLREIEKLLSGAAMLWEDKFENLTVNQGLQDICEKYWKGSAYTAAHYVGLTDGTPTVAAGDTAAQIGGSNAWSEVTAYSETNRQTLTLGTPTLADPSSVDNVGNTADFSINAGPTTVGGAFVITNNTKSGTTGDLICGSAFSGGDKTGLGSGDTLSVTATLTIGDDA